jgi:hypothetical protein
MTTDGKSCSTFAYSALEKLLRIPFDNRAFPHKLVLP